MYICKFFLLLLSVFLLFSLSCGQTTTNEGWVESSLKIQKNLISSFAIDKAPLVGTHNSYSSPVYYSLFKNQELSITAQLELGVRFMELDLHVIKELNNTETGGEYRICHASKEIYEACDKQIGWYYCNQFGLQNFFEDTGCSSLSPSFSQIFSEISEWMYTNPDNVIIINFDDQITEEDNIRITNMSNIVNGWLDFHFGKLIYTPQNYIDDGEQWPTIQTLIDRRKSIIFNTNGYTFGEVFIHQDLRGFVWPDSKVKYFPGFPACVSTSYSGAIDDIRFSFFQEDLFVFSILNSVVYNGTAQVGNFDDNSALSVARCEYSTLLDFISPTSAAKLIWSWEINEPSNTKECGSLNYNTGKWRAEDCSTSHYFACRSNSNSSVWSIGPISSPRTKFSLATVCEGGYSFDTPKTAKENYELLQAISSISLFKESIWISMTRYPNGSWINIPLEEMSSTSSTTSTSTSGSSPIDSPAVMILPLFYFVSFVALLHVL